MKNSLLLHSFIFFLASISCRNKVENNRAAVVSSKDSVAVSSANWELVPFEKIDSVNPVMKPGNGSFMCPVRKQKVAWEQKDVFNPAVAVRMDTLFLLYRAQDKIGKPDGTSRIGLAWSIDGEHFTRLHAPVLYPDNDRYKKYEWQGGCEDPRLVEDSLGTYYMTYTAYEGKTARLFVATSTDLRHWTKHGSAFEKAYNGKYMNAWSKSGSIVSSYVNGKIVATKINGKYWMYWGDKYIWAAISDDLLNWMPVETTTSEKQSFDSVYANFNIASLKIVVPTRRGKFDNNLVEPGPPAMLTDKGIVLLYNGRNVPKYGDTSLAEGTYAASEVLLDKSNPLKIIDRMNTWFIKPEKSYEILGQVNNVCFIEGLAQFKNRWWLYYGTADSKIAVAVK
ncbi:MAG TPA: glycoside hydrolase family 130 protein [Chitinophagaceae bacterium]